MTLAAETGLGFSGALLHSRVSARNGIGQRFFQLFFHRQRYADIHVFGIRLHFHQPITISDTMTDNLINFVPHDDFGTLDRFARFYEKRVKNWASILGGS